ncbi:hypothetical protein [uncultured Sphingomonas sp.]|uniref:hypothetical protein n=1 Tax=uncultured Sphingomonas sp. TaxID=158754 RepID=UPI0035CB2932
MTGPKEESPIVALGDAAAWSIQGLIGHVRPELERRITDRGGDLAPMMEAAE